MAWDALAAYDSLTGGRSRALRVDALCRLAAERFPGMLPGEAELAAEAPLPQRDKKGLEKAQGRFLAAVLGDPAAGTHLCRSMLLPREDSATHMAQFEAKGVLELAGAKLQRQGKAAVLTMRNPRYLNAEDETTIDGMEIAVDVALLDSKSELVVLRGDTVTHTKHAGQHVFGAGINLTHLYQGRIRYLWYIIRDLGLVNKLYRGLALPGVHPEEDSIEKPVVAAVERFAIGGHCQLLLTMDYVIAAERRLHDAAGEEGRHHPGRRQPAPAALAGTRTRVRRSSPGGGWTAPRPRGAWCATRSRRWREWIRPLRTSFHC